MGTAFAFLACQKGMAVDNRDDYFDLHAHHRCLKSLLTIALQIGALETGFKGHMKYSLRDLEKYEMTKGESLPIGPILCTGNTGEHV